MRRAERWLCVLAALVGGIFGGGLSARIWPGVTAMAQTNQSPQTVKAQKFVLVDETGKERGTMEAQAGGAAYLVLLDQKGKRRMGLGAETSGAALNLFHSDGKTLRAALRIRPDGSSEVVVVDGRGQPRSGMSVNELGVADQP